MVYKKSTRCYAKRISYTKHLPHRLPNVYWPTDQGIYTGHSFTMYLVFMFFDIVNWMPTFGPYRLQD